MRLYFAGLRHSKGEWAGRQVELEPWQLFILGSLFAWRRLDGRRRFRTVYAEVPRKNGKSTTAAGVGLLLAFDDDEPGAEVYAAATKREQAKIVWSEAKRMVLRSPALRSRITPLVANLNEHTSASKFEPLGSDADSTDGLNIHAAIIDELHAHKTRAMWDVLETAIGARRQPVLFVITTAGDNRGGVCYEQHQYAKKILEGVLEDDATFGMIYTIDNPDAWNDPTEWAKANPNLGVSCKLEKLQEMARRAEQMPAAKTAFLIKHLNVWVNADETFMPAAAWAACAGDVDVEQLAGKPCWIGVDLASKSDLAAAVAVWVDRDADGQISEVWIKPRFYLPEDTVNAGASAEMAHFKGWSEQGHLVLTPGTVIDFRVIRDDLKALAARVALEEIDFDPYQATQISTELADEGYTLVEIPQTTKHLSGPMKAWRDLVIGRKLHHDGNPVMTWCVSNVVAKEDANENVFPRKMSRELKIDGVTAMLNAFNRALVEDPTSVYETRGVEFV